MKSAAPRRFRPGGLKKIDAAGTDPLPEKAIAGIAASLHNEDAPDPGESLPHVRPKSYIRRFRQ